MHLGKALGLSLALTLGGCASFTADKVAPVSLPSMASYSNKPNVYVDFDFYVGEVNGPAIEMPLRGDPYKPKVQKLFTDSGLFGRVTLDERQKQAGDYTVRLKVYTPELNGGQMVMAMITGFTFFVIPSFVADEFTATLETVDDQGKVSNRLSNYDKVNSVMGLVALPLAFKTTNAAIDDTLARQINALLKQMVDSQQLKYSALGQGIPRG